MFIFYRRYYLTITPWPIKRMQLLIRGAAGFLSRPDNNRRAKVRLFYFIANNVSVFFCISVYFHPYFQHKEAFTHLRIAKSAPLYILIRLHQHSSFHIKEQAKSY